MQTFVDCCKTIINITMNIWDEQTPVKDVDTIYKLSTCVTKLNSLGFCIPIYKIKRIFQTVFCKFSHGNSIIIWSVYAQELPM